MATSFAANYDRERQDDRTVLVRGTLESHAPMIAGKFVMPRRLMLEGDITIPKTRSKTTSHPSPFKGEWLENLIRIERKRASG